MNSIYKSIVFILCMSTFQILSANESSSEEELAKKSQNPIGNIISVPFEFWHYDQTDAGAEVDAMFIKPVYPVTVDEYTIINRFIIPVLDVENKGDDFQLPNSSIIPSGASKTGLGNIQYQGFVTSANPGDIIWGLGVAVELPTHAGNLGTDKYSAGPSAIVLTMPGHWVVGALAQNIFDIGGPGDDKINQFLFQYFINYNFGNGWYAVSAPIITADWEASSGNKWTVPLGGGIGKLHRFGGKIPVDFKLQAYKHIEKPSGGSDWSMVFAVKFLFPK